MKESAATGRSAPDPYGTIPGAVPEPETLDISPPEVIPSDVRDTIFGRLALLHGLVDQETLDKARSEQSTYPAKLLADVLMEMGALAVAERQALEVLLARHLSRLQENPQASISSLVSFSTQVNALVSLGDTISAASDSLLPRRVFGHYELLGEIARGGMGVVYKARQTKLNRLVALKMIRSGELADEEQVRRFYVEAEAAAKLDHPGIVPVFEVGEIDGQHYFSMAFVQGRSLNDRVKADGPLPPKVAAKLLQTVANAVQFAHDKGIVHRDIKPQNILLDEKEQPRVADFGLAKQAQGASEMTTTGQVLGTPSYMPPEQAAGRVSEVGKSADVYSLGATLYCLLTGRPPFQASSLAETIRQVLEVQPVPLRRLNPEIPRDLETICLKCLRKEPEKRYASANNLAEDLDCWLNDKPIAARPVGRAERTWLWCKRRPALIGLSLVFLVLSVFGTLAGTLISLERQNQIRAQGLVEKLVSADTPQVPEIVKQLEEYQKWANPLLEQRLIQAAEGSIEKLHLSLARVGSDDSLVKYLYNQLLNAEPNQFGVVRDSLRPYQESIAVPLWKTLHDSSQVTNRRFRSGLALAAYATNSDQWTPADKAFVAEQLVATNPEDQPLLRDYLRPFSDQLLGHLEILFSKPDLPESQKLGSANALGDFAGTDGSRLARLISLASPAQYKILYPRLGKLPSKSVKEVLSEMVSHQPAANLPPAQRLALGKQRANAAITLLRQGDREGVLGVLRIQDDPEALTQFVHGCRAREVHPLELLACLDAADKVRQAKTSVERELEDRVLFGLLSGLGEYSLEELPPPQRQPLVERIAAWHASDPSSTIHGATGWLLRHWNKTDLVEKVAQTPVPYSPNRQWFTLAIKFKTAGRFGLAIGAREQTFFMTFVVTPSGEFEIGSPIDESERGNEEIRHKVHISRPFAILDREITRGEFEAFGQPFGGYQQFSPTPAHVMGGPSWYHSVEFCRWLTARTGLSEDEQCYADPKSLDRKVYGSEPDLAAGDMPRNWPLQLEKRGFRLPTEAEWEIVARCGMRSAYGFGQDDSLLERYGWFQSNSATGTHLPCELRPNLRGLFDMHGNVYEWCHDWYGNYVLGEGHSDPSGILTGSYRVGRGGGWSGFASDCRTASRKGNQPAIVSRYFGFRLALSPSEVSPEADPVPAAKPADVGTE